MICPGSLVTYERISGYTAGLPSQFTTQRVAEFGMVVAVARGALVGGKLLHESMRMGDIYEYAYVVTERFIGWVRCDELIA